MVNTHKVRSAINASIKFGDMLEVTDNHIIIGVVASETISSGLNKKLKQKTGRPQKNGAVSREQIVDALTQLGKSSTARAILDHILGVDTGSVQARRNGSQVLARMARDGLLRVPAADEGKGRPRYAITRRAANGAG